ncbi:MAG TPA: HDIG domain-containing protein [Bacteroidota bacterium]|nr:HDIG domain-containing protein [Bacteroidota bacterium]
MALGKFRRNVRSGSYPLTKILIFLALTGLLTLLTPHGELVEISYTVGNVWIDSDLISPYPFPIVKDQKTYASELAAAEKTSPPVFRRRERAYEESADSLRRILADLARVLQGRGAASGAVKNTSRPADGAGVLPFRLSDAEWGALAGINRSTRGGIRAFFAVSHVDILEILREIYRSGVLDTGRIKQHHPVIALRQGNREEIMSVGRVYEPSEAHSVIGSGVEASPGGAAGSVILKCALAVFRPNLIFDGIESAALVQAARDNVPRTVGFVQENERIVGKHDKITAGTKLKLDSFLKAKAERAIDSGAWRYWAGSALHVGVILSIFCIYLVLFRRGIYRDDGKLVLIALIILLEALFAWLTVRMEVPQPMQYLILVPAASMLLTIIFDSRIGFFGTVVIAFIVASVRGNDYAIALSSLIAGGFAAYTVRDIRNRTQIFRSLVFIFLGYALSILALGFEQFESLGSIATQLSFALANSVFSPVVTYGLLIFFEKAFRVTTDLTLLELSDINHPLLRQLSEKAPGTFHHSMVLGNLSESAAEAIGANPILARVGAYYHDIGKGLKPEYFVENQIGAHNKHARLRPRMSALIIASHVKEGAELGRQHRLPEMIVDFIYQHHGTNRISFFYEKAVKQAARKQDAASIHEEDFRYPGPKPQSKEAGIVMLADSVEASIRSVEYLTPPKMEEHIGEMIRQRFLEGQLDECELTLRDLSKIREAFLKILVGIHHQRIRYPDQPGIPDQADAAVPQDGAATPAVAPDSPPRKTRESNKRPVSRTDEPAEALPEAPPAGGEEPAAGAQSMGEGGR